MYIPVIADIDIAPLINKIEEIVDKSLELAIVATIQYQPYLVQLQQQLTNYTVTLPKIDPLPEGITLGCTVPPLKNEVMSVVFIGGGLFHAEAVAYNYPNHKVFSYPGDGSADAGGGLGTAEGADCESGTEKNAGDGGCRAVIRCRAGLFCAGYRDEIRSGAACGAGAGLGARHTASAGMESV